MFYYLIMMRKIFVMGYLEGILAKVEDLEKLDDLPYTNMVQKMILEA